MKLTILQLRKIIKEEVDNTTIPASTQTRPSTERVRYYIEKLLRALDSLDNNSGYAGQRQAAFAIKLEGNDLMDDIEDLYELLEDKYDLPQNKIK